MAITPKAQATAARISEVAASLFFEQGFESTTVAQVAEESGVATGTVLLHFGSKSDLATAAFALRIAAAVGDAVDSLPDRPAPDQVSHIVEHLYTWYASHGDVAPVLLRESLFSSGPSAQHYSDVVVQTMGAFQAICVTHQSQGRLAAEADAALLAEGILADYLLVLLQGLRGSFSTVDAQLAHFNDLAALRWTGAEVPG